MALTAGSDFSGDLASMAATIEDEFKDAWYALYGSHLPSQGIQQRRVFYNSIARGVLRYLKQKEDHPEFHFATTLDLRERSSGVERIYEVLNVEWNVDDV